MISTILTGAAGRAVKTLQPLRQPTGPLDALVMINRAMPDMRSALGDDIARTMGKALFDASRRGSTRTAASRLEVREALETLEHVASSTARTRVLVGGLAIGGAYLGYRLLTADRDAGVPMAPGPINQPGAPDLDYSNYA